MDNYPPILHYKGILNEWIFRKLILEMKDYGVSASFDMEVLFRINKFMIKCIL